MTSNIEDERSYHRGVNQVKVPAVSIMLVFCRDKRNII